MGDAFSRADVKTMDGIRTRFRWECGRQPAGPARLAGTSSNANAIRRGPVLNRDWHSKPLLINSLESCGWVLGIRTAQRFRRPLHMPVASGLLNHEMELAGGVRLRFIRVSRRHGEESWRRLNGGERKSMCNNEIESGESGIRDGRGAVVSCCCEMRYGWEAGIRTRNKACF